MIILRIGHREIIAGVRFDGQSIVFREHQQTRSEKEVWDLLQDENAVGDLALIRSLFATRQDLAQFLRNWAARYETVEIGLYGVPIAFYEVAIEFVIKAAHNEQESEPKRALYSIANALRKKQRN